MRAAARFFQPLVRLTLFTRDNCGLCDSAKLAVSSARKQLDVNYQEVDIMQQNAKHWRDQYEFDVPVLHAEKISPEADSGDPLKLMHRFTDADVQRLVEAAGK